MAEGETRGTVRKWSDGDGWGVVDSLDTPGGCWVHVSHVGTPGYVRLRPGDDVVLRFEPADQDGFAFRAVKLWPAGEVEPPDREPDVRGPSAAYRSGSTIRMDRDHQDDGVGDG